MQDPSVSRADVEFDLGDAAAFEQFLRHPTVSRGIDEEVEFPGAAADHLVAVVAEAGDEGVVDVEEDAGVGCAERHGGRIRAEQPLEALQGALFLAQVLAHGQYGVLAVPLAEPNAGLAGPQSSVGGVQGQWTVIAFAVEHLGEDARGLLAVFGSVQAEEVRAQHFAEIVAHALLESAVRVQEPAVEVDDHRDVVDPLEERAEVAFAVFDLALGPLQRRKIAPHAEEGRRTFEGDPGQADLDRDRGAVAPLVRPLEAAGSFLVGQLRHLPGEALRRAPTRLAWGREIGRMELFEGTG